MRLNRNGRRKSKTNENGKTEMKTTKSIMHRLMVNGFSVVGRSTSTTVFLSLNWIKSESARAQKKDNKNVVDVENAICCAIAIYFLLHFECAHFCASVHSSHSENDFILHRIIFRYCHDGILSLHILRVEKGKLDAIIESTWANLNHFPLERCRSSHSFSGTTEFRFEVLPTKRENIAHFARRNQQKVREI